MASITVPLGKGTATGIDPSLTEMLQESEGVVYKPGDPAAHKFPGRTSLVTPTAEPVVGVVGARLDVAAGGTPINLLAVRTSQSAAQFMVDLSTGTSSTIHTGSDTALMLEGLQVGRELFLANNNTNRVWKNNAGSVTSYPHGLLYGTTITNVSTGLIAGSLTGSYTYWITEYDSANGVESGVGYGAVTLARWTSTAAPAAQGVRITKAYTGNSTADKWRIYRTIDTGSWPIGWLVAEVAIATTTYDDTTLTDADLVLNTPFRVVSINNIVEQMDEAPPPFKSMTTFEGSLVGVVIDGGYSSTRTTQAIYYSETGEPHSFPFSYAIGIPTKYGDYPTCVRTCGSALYVMTETETHRINYLPKGADSYFDSGIVRQHIANYGTPSPQGACTFTGWGGKPVMFVASKSGPVLINDDGVDRAVRHIDWPNTIVQSVLSKCKAIDNPDQMRIELYFQASATDTTSWKVLHFYYDPQRIENTSGTFPEMAWTGPHLVPGLGEYVVVSGAGSVYTGSKTSSGTIYKEGVGTDDAANLVDGSGTINFRAKLPRIYPAGHDTQATVKRVYVHKNGTGTGNYTLTVTTFNDEGGSVAAPRTVSAVNTGDSSTNMNAACKAVEVRIVRDDDASMPPINNVTLKIDDTTGAVKTVTA